ncbi:hypothetical protein FACS189472_14510 [Alphaproteobacteria bacterium]|nr:hypothetical protein FACS189472_14510 [Alphaproteobacteria bacterium]
MIRLSIFSAIIIFLFTDTRATRPVVPNAEPTYAIDDRNISDLMRSASDIMDEINSLADNSKKNTATAILSKTMLVEPHNANTVRESTNVKDVVAEEYKRADSDHAEFAAYHTSIYNMFDTAKITKQNNAIAVKFEVIDKEAEENQRVEEMVLSSGCCGFLCSIFSRKKK